MKVIQSDEVAKRLAALEGWCLTPEGIEKQYDLGSFASVMQLVNRVADLAEEADHHPEIRITYGKVTFTLTTHDAGGITEKDFDLARQIEAIAP